MPIAVCVGPSVPVPAGAPETVATLHAAAVDLADALQELAAAVRLESRFDTGWPASGAIANVLYEFQVKMLEASGSIEQVLEASGGTIVDGEWALPADAPPSLPALATAWADLMTHQVDVLGPLLIAKNTGEVTSIVDGTEWCRPAFGLSTAVDTLLTEGRD